MLIIEAGQKLLLEGSAAGALQARDGCCVSGRVQGAMLIEVKGLCLLPTEPLSSPQVKPQWCPSARSSTLRPHTAQVQASPALRANPACSLMG